MDSSFLSYLFHTIKHIPFLGSFRALEYGFWGYARGSTPVLCRTGLPHLGDGAPSCATGSRSFRIYPFRMHRQRSSRDTSVCLSQTCDQDQHLTNMRLRVFYKNSIFCVFWCFLLILVTCLRYDKRTYLVKNLSSLPVHQKQAKKLFQNGLFYHFLVLLTQNASEGI